MQNTLQQTEISAEDQALQQETLGNSDHMPW